MAACVRRVFAGVTVLAVALVLFGAADARPQLGMALRPLDASTPITYFVADGTPQTGFRAADRQLAVWAFEDWQRASASAIRFERTAEADARVRLYWAESSAGQYGEMQPLDVGGRRGAAVFIRPDMDALGPEIARRTFTDALLRDTIVYLTCVHELGHAIGLAHTSDFRDVMYFFGYGGDIGEYFGRYRARLRSRNDIAAASGLSASDVNRLKAMYAAR